MKDQIVFSTGGIQVVFTRGGIAALKIAADCLASSTRTWSSAEIAQWLRDLAADQRKELLAMAAAEADRATLERLLREAAPAIDPSRCAEDLLARIASALNLAHPGGALRVVQPEEP